jgi:4'-phosphopantetheinyl transferase
MKMEGHHFMQNDGFQWPTTSELPILEMQDFHVWRVSLHDSLEKAQKLYPLLAEDEVIRASRFHFSRDRNTFIVARGLLRTLIGAYTQLAPQNIKFQYSAQGKPFLDPNQTNTTLNFNLSHSHELALLAFTRNDAIGIDIEYMRPEVAHEQIAERYFSLQEISDLRALPRDLQSAAFFDCWTRKEAFIKATGEGLTRPLDQFSMSLTPGEPARLLHLEGESQEQSTWHIQHLDVEINYRAAVAIKRPIRHMYCWECLIF